MKFNFSFLPDFLLVLTCFLILMAVGKCTLIKLLTLTFEVTTYNYYFSKAFPENGQIPSEKRIVLPSQVLRLG